MPHEPAIIWDPTDHGESAAEKIKRVRQALANQYVNARCTNSTLSLGFLLFVVMISPIIRFVLVMQ